MTGALTRAAQEKRAVGSDSPVFVVHAAVLRTGRVLLFSGTAEVGYPLARRHTGSASDTFSAAQPGHDEDLFCSGHTFLTDGRLIVAGGAPQYNLPSTHMFDPATETWTKLVGHDMNVAGRWYPTHGASRRRSGLRG